MTYVKRDYRAVIAPAGLTCYEITLGESDLYICTDGNHAPFANESLARHRGEIEVYIERHPTFQTSFRPVPAATGAPEIVRAMSETAEMCDVGPMASVAGAIAQFVGTDLLSLSRKVIVENGGDVFLSGSGMRKVRVFAGTGSSPVDILVEDSEEGVGVCTSSATVGPSISLGKADAVTVLARTATLADAAATMIGNTVLCPADIRGGLDAGREQDGVLGVMIMAQGSMGVWGAIEINRLGRIDP